MTVRVAGAADVEAVVETITLAFRDDPVWGFLERPDVLWRALVTAGLRYPWTFVDGTAAAVAVWLPPGGIELTDDEADDLAGRLGPDRPGVDRVFAAFDGAHPHEPHFYLSLLATHPAHRGQGRGVALLRENLTRTDAAGVPAYLESSNPVNDARYAAAGFRPRGRVVVSGGPAVTTMLRPVTRTE